ncbi:MAG: type I restriction enzyme HsdR N-terminal domain-containing protein [Blastochloris sp.]|nr:type I restriction enzyme HsdR N-terminal domain-containing protein [Blastochloris sp.]
MTPNFHSELEEHFYAYLLNRGYPRDSILFEVRLGDRHRPDFAVTDLSRDQHIAFFEMKAQITPATQSRIFEQIKAYSEAAKAVGAPCYLVTPAKSPTFEEPFDFYYVDKDNNVQQLAKELFPSYPSLASNSAATKKSRSRRILSRRRIIFS